MMKRILIVAAGFFLLAGCGNKTFVYKPSVLASDTSKLPVKIAVLPFADGTENFTRRGGLVSREVHKVNLAKSAGGDMINGLPPEYWSKALADEMAASGRFEAVRFLYNRLELTDEDFFMDGTLEKAYLDFGTSGEPHEFGMALRATRRTDTQKVWEKNFRTVSKNSTGIADRCQTKQCQIDVYHDVVNRAMRELFAEAGADLVRALEPLLETSAGSSENPGDDSPTVPSAESVDKMIEDILKGK
jgi:hypothetical protein